MRNLTIQDFCEIQDNLNQQMTAFQDKPWYKYLNEDMLTTQILVEMTESIAETDMTFKWWKSPKGQFDPADVKMELIDALHFYLGKWILVNYRNGATLDDISRKIVDRRMCPLAGHDHAKMYDEEGILDHGRYNSLIKALQSNNIEVVLDYISGFGGMMTEEMAATYYAKATLNEIRTSAGMKEGKYTNKPSNGMEDSKRLKPIIDAFMNDFGMSLEDVRKSTFEEFFKVAA